MEEVIQNQKEIIKRLDIIENRLIILAENETRLSTHIDFVESIYEKIKTPFHLIMDKVTLFIKV